MTCEKARAALDELVFGELDSEAEIELQLHLSACAECGAEERRRIALRDAVRGTRVAPDAALRERIRAALASPAAAPRPAWFARPVPAWAALALAVLAAVAVGAGLRGAAARTPAREETLPASRLTPLPRGSERFFTTAAWFVMPSGTDSAGERFRPPARGTPGRTDSL